MKNKELARALTVLANDLDIRGFHKEAAQVDRIFQKVADDRQFAIKLTVDVVVPAAEMNKTDENPMYDPPAATHLRAAGKLAVYPVQNGVVSAVPVMEKQITGRNVDTVKAALSNFIDAAKAKYPGASMDEAIEYKAHG